MSVPLKTENATRKVIGRVLKSSTIWNRLIQLTGGVLALHKLMWRMLAYKVLNRDLKIIATLDNTIVMENRLGGYIAIEFVIPN